MSMYEYLEGRKLADAPFYALIQAAMRKADSSNLEKLQKAFPETWAELQARYNAPGGELPSDGQQQVVVAKPQPTLRDTDLRLVSDTAAACEWADFPGTCQEWLEEHDTLTVTMRDRLESMLSRANDGEFDRRGR